MATQLISYYGDKKENNMNSEHGIDVDEVIKMNNDLKLDTCSLTAVAVTAPVLIVWKTGGIKTILILGIAVSGNGTI